MRSVKAGKKRYQMTLVLQPCVCFVNTVNLLRIPSIGRLKSWYYFTNGKNRFCHMTADIENHQFCVNKEIISYLFGILLFSNSTTKHTYL